MAKKVRLMPRLVPERFRHARSTRNSSIDHKDRGSIPQKQKNVNNPTHRAILRSRSLLGRASSIDNLLRTHSASGGGAPIDGLNPSSLSQRDTYRLGRTAKGQLDLFLEWCNRVYTVTMIEIAPPKDGGYIS